MKYLLAPLALLSLLSRCVLAQDPAPAPAAPVVEMPPPAFAPAAPDPNFIVHNGDIWVQVGDSITAQNLYTAYLDAFTRARYPKLKFVAVNSGVSGQVFIQARIRFRNSIAAYKPTFVTVNFGMNDHVKVFGGEDFQNNPENEPQRFMNSVARIPNARLFVMTPSPLLAPADYGQSVENLLDPANAKKAHDRSNPVLRLFSDKLKLAATRNNVPVLDQQPILQQIWAANYERDQFMAAISQLRPLLVEPITAENVKTRWAGIVTALRTVYNSRLPFSDAANFAAKRPGNQNLSVEEWEAYRLYLEDWVKQVDSANPPFVRLSGYTGSVRAWDVIHPNEAGHLHMAGVLFKLMNADGLVSSVEIDAKTGKFSSQKATVSAVSTQNGLSFKRLDESLPLPIDPLARPGLGVDVKTDLGTPKDLFGMNRYLLSVTSLPKGTYSVQIDGEEVAKATTDELAKGIDLGFTEKGPVATQSLKLWEAVKANFKSAVPPGAAPPPVEPTILPEAQPVEHMWTIKLAK